MPTINTHNLIVDFGKHKGERWTRLPVSYLKWLVNEGTQHADIARAELERRGTILTQNLEITGHAIDRASQQCLSLWKITAEKDEGLHSWLYRLANEALEQTGGREDAVVYHNMKFVFHFGEVYPTLKTVMKK